jgi:hypothetical protein
MYKSLITGINDMKIKLTILTIVVISMLDASISVSASDSDAYIGGGLNYLELDEGDSVNFSVTAGYSFLKQS